MGIRYETERYFTKTIIRLEDPVFHRPWYLKGINRTGGYSWTSDPLYARTFSEKTALKHKEALENGADKDWKSFRDSWAAYYREIKQA